MKSKKCNENVICALCGDDTKKEKVLMWVGGYVGHAHKSCVEIGQSAISLYERWVLFHLKLLPDWQKKQAKKRKDGKS